MTIQILFGITIGIAISLFFEFKLYHLILLILFFIFVYTINIFIHEVGHMIFGKMVKINTKKIQIGRGQKVVFKFRFLGTPVEITNLMIGGSSFPDDFENKNIKTKFFIYIFGGFFFNACAALVSYLASVNLETKILSTVLMVFCYSNIFSALLALIPFKIKSHGMSLPNDGLKLIQIPFYKEQQLQQFLISGKILQVTDLIKEKKYNEAKKILEKAVEIFPENIVAKILLASLYIPELKIEKAQKMFRELLNNLDSSEEKFKYIIMYELAYLSLFETNDELADDYSKQIYNYQGQYMPYKIIRGCVLINSEKTKEGIDVLKKCANLKKDINKINNNKLAFLYLAYGFYKEEKIKKAIAYIEAVEAQINSLAKEDKYLYDKIINKTNNFDRKKQQTANG